MKYKSSASFGYTLSNILPLVERLDSLFVPPISDRVNLKKYVQKIARLAALELAYTDEEELVGMIAFYNNDNETGSAYITFLGILPKFQRQGIAHKLLERCMEDCRKHKMKEIGVETWEANVAVIRLYEKFGFLVKSVEKDRKNTNSIKTVEKVVNNTIITPLEKYPRLSEELDIDIRVKHDNFYPFAGGGSKGRKLRYMLADMMNKKTNALVSAGSVNSNHARAVALLGAQKGWPVKLIIHDKEDYSNGNLLLMNLAGADLIFVDHAEVAGTMDRAMAALSADGYKPYYIWGGGHNVHGMEAFYDAVAEVKQQLGDWIPDYIIHASGTGGTQAGLHVGAEEYYPETKVIGISVARKKQRGQKAVEEAVKEFGQYLKIGNSEKQVIFKDDWIGNGYGSIYPELKQVINKAARFGLITDPIYTGKALLGLFDLCKQGYIPKKSKVLFWHTGGMINLFRHWEKVVSKEVKA